MTWFPILWLSGGLLWAQTPQTVFQGAMISSGRNRPSISLSKENLVKLCALLHNRVPFAELPDRLVVSNEELRHKLDLLVREGLAKQVSEDRFLPSCVVVNREDAQKYFQPDDRVIRAAARLIRKDLPEVKSRCEQIRSLADVPFKAMSFFVGSDVLLDNWQISNVERLFVKAERPLRSGGRYYYMIFEKPANQTAEPFGIYGNTGSQWGAVQIGLYGNDRFSGRTLLSIPDEQFGQVFGFDSSMDLKEARRQLAARLVEALQGHSGVLTMTERQALSRIGLIHGDQLQVLLLQGDDYKALDHVAEVVTNQLVALLEQNRGRLLATYRDSPYSEETSFNEYFMCWYHFFYTAVTNRLRDEGVIDVPANGTTTYLVAQ